MLFRDRAPLYTAPLPRGIRHSCSSISSVCSVVCATALPLLEPIRAAHDVMLLQVPPLSASYSLWLTRTGSPRSSDRGGAILTAQARRSGGSYRHPPPHRLRPASSQMLVYYNKLHLLLELLASLTDRHSPEMSSFPGSSFPADVQFQICDSGLI